METVPKRAKPSPPQRSPRRSGSPSERPTRSPSARSTTRRRWTWTQLQRARRRARRRARAARLKRGDTSRCCSRNRPEFHLIDLAAMTLGATPFSIYQTYAPEQIEFVVSDADARDPRSPSRRTRQRARGAQGLPDLEHVIVVDGDAPEGCLPLAEVEGVRPGLRRRRLGRRDRARRHPDADLHVGHDRPAEGRPAHPPQPAGRGPGRRGADRLPRGRRASSPGCPARTSPSATPTTTCRSSTAADHALPRPARRSLPTCRRCARRGSSPSRGSGRSSRPAWRPRSPACREEQRERRRRARGGDREGPRSSSAASRCPTTWPRRSPRPTSSSSRGWRAMLGLDQVEAINVGAAPTPVEVLEFFHAIGLPLAELWGMSETCGAGHGQPAGQDQDRHRRPARPRASRSSSPRTARSSSRATS